MRAKKKNKKRMDNMTKLLIPLAVAINMLAYTVLYSTTMLILGDSIGTILVGAICGPGPGAIVGLLSTLGPVIENIAVYTNLWIYRWMVKWKYYFPGNGWRFLGKSCQCFCRNSAL